MCLAVVGCWSAAQSCSTNYHRSDQHSVTQPRFSLQYLLLPSSPHLSARLGDFWILGLPVLPHLPHSGNLELLTKAVKGESQLVTVAIEGCRSGFLVISNNFGGDSLSSSQTLRLKTVGIHTPAVTTISWVGCQAGISTL